MREVISRTVIQPASSCFERGTARLIGELLCFLMRSESKATAHGVLTEERNINPKGATGA